MAGGPTTLPLTELASACTVTCLAAVFTSEYVIYTLTRVLGGTLRFRRNYLSTARLCCPMPNLYHAKRAELPIVAAAR